MDDLRDPALATQPGNSRRPVCARDVQDLAWALEEAIRSGDANRIAALYDWAGMGTANANRVMNLLGTDCGCSTRNKMLGCIELSQIPNTYRTPA